MRQVTAAIIEGTWIFCRFQYLGQGTVARYWKIEVEAELSINPKRTSLGERTNELTLLDSSRLATSRIWCWIDVPPSDFYLYINSLLPGIEAEVLAHPVTPDHGETGPSQTSIRLALSANRPADVVGLYWSLHVGGFTGSIAFVERSQWQAAVAMSSFRRAGGPARPD